MERAGAKVLMASVRDRFGDYGRVALATLRPPPPLALSGLVSHTLWHFLARDPTGQEARQALCEAANVDAHDAPTKQVLAQDPDAALSLQVCVDEPPPPTHTLSLSLSEYWC